MDKLARKVREDVLRAGAAATAKVVYDEAKLNASRHVKTGTLYSAIYRFHVDDKSSASAQTYHIGWNHRTAPHGQLLEFGTSNAPAYPFMRPAFDQIGAAMAAGLERMRERLAQHAPALPATPEDA